jgi:hypothetical protein
MPALRRGTVWMGVVLLAAAATAGLAFNGAGFSQDTPQKKLLLRDFMRRKLEASNKILEGLVTEDSELIAAGAETLVEMSTAEKWRVSNDVMYKQFSEEFQRTAKKLKESAEKDKFDDVALKWIATTMNCIECHRWVRGMRIAEPAP